MCSVSFPKIKKLNLNFIVSFVLQQNRINCGFSMRELRIVSNKMTKEKVRIFFENLRKRD